MYEMSTAEVMDRGLNCLLEQLGVVEIERFISIIREVRLHKVEKGPVRGCQRGRY